MSNLVFFLVSNFMQKVNLNLRQFLCLSRVKFYAIKLISISRVGIFLTRDKRKKNPTREVEINFFVKFNTTPRWIQKFPTVTLKEQECSAARQAMAATAQQWCFAEVLSCSSGHGGCSLVVFSHYNWRPLRQSVKTLPALSCQVCKLASHIGHGVVSAPRGLQLS